MDSPAISVLGDSPAATLLRDTDWSVTPLGRMDLWSSVLRSHVMSAMSSPLAIAIIWGDDLTTIYNDAYARILGNRHPETFGRSFRQIWASRWVRTEPFIRLALGGQSSLIEDAPFTIPHVDGETSAWITFSCSPLFDENGQIKGVMATCLETTAKVRLSLAREQETARLQALYDQAPGLVIVTRGPDHVIEFMNAAQRQFFGGVDLTGMPAKEAMPDIAAQGFGDLIDRVFRTGESFVGNEVPVQVQRIPGGSAEERYFDFVYQPIRDLAGNVSGIFAEGVDVTERVLQARAQRENDEKIWQLANMIPQQAWIADANGLGLWYNQRWYDYTGLTVEETLGAGWQRVIDPADLDEVSRRWQESVASGTPFESTQRMRGKDGIYRPFYTLAVPLKDATGNVVQWFGTSTDVSPLHAAQEELRRTRNWLEQGLETGRMIVWEYDLVSGQLKSSDNARDLLGYAFDTAEEHFARVHPEDAPMLRQIIETAIAERGRFRATTRRIDPNTGAVRWMEQRGQILCGRDGAPAAIIGVNVEVTDRVNAENALKDANRRKDEFLAMLAHELRNPLAPIRSAASLLQLPGVDEVRIRRACEIVHRQVDHMATLLDDLLDVSRVTRGLVTLEKVPIDIKSVIASTLEQARPLIEANRHELRIRMASAASYVEGDQTRLVQALTNLLNNACKYTPRGGCITLELDVGENDVHLRVADNGIGMEAEFVPHVFGLFTQATRTADRSQGGLGIGLALVKSIIQMHGGQIEAHSDGLGKGSNFEITLPRLAALPPKQEISPSPPLRRAGTPRRIMVVDDNADAAGVLALLLEEAGHKVTVMSDAHDALRDPSLDETEVFILDIGLPGIDGLELARRLRMRPALQHVRLIAVSGYGQESDRTQATKAGFDVYLIKPVSANQIQDAIGQCASSVSLQVSADI